MGHFLLRVLVLTVLVVALLHLTLSFSLAADDEKHVTAGQLALAWLLAQGEDVVPIPGTKRRENLEQNAGACTVSLSEDDLQRLEAAEVGAAFETIRNTPGAIFDMRGYPASGARAVVARLARSGAPPAVIGGGMRYDGVSGSFSLEEALWTLEEYPPGERYAGRVVLLADGSSQSAAEHVCALIKSVAAVTFIGSRTSGANGGVTRTVLPGGIVVNFTGQSVRHRDGSQLQRIGIVPDVEAHPTLQGIRAGRDDVLERAIEFLDRGK